MIINRNLIIKTLGNCDIVDITNQIEAEIHDSNLINGIATIFIRGSTAGLSTIEYENGVIDDYKEMVNRTIPSTINYQHNLKWGDGNGHSHIRATLQGPSLVIPFSNKKMALGTWQQIVLIDYDTRPRNRDIFLQLMGE